MLNQSIDGSDTPATGTDLTRAPAAAAAVRRSEASGRVIVSEPYEVVRDRSLPTTQRQLSFVLAAPVRAGGVQPGTPEVLGWVVMSLRGRDFITTTLQKFAQDLGDVTLLVSTASRRPVTVADLRAAEAGPRTRHDTSSAAAVRPRRPRASVRSAASAPPDTNDQDVLDVPERPFRAGRALQAGPNYITVPLF